MNLSNLVYFFNKVTRPLQKRAPEILLGIGTVGVVTAGVLACKQTLKVQDILDESTEQMRHIEGVREDKAYSEKYSEEDYKKDVVIVRGRTAVKLAKNYALPVAVAGLSIAAIFAGHGIQMKRYAALSSAYFALDQGFRKYRENVVEHFGEDMEKEIRYGIKAQEITEAVVDENGEVKEETKTIYPPKTDGSPYARFFDEVTCPGTWTNDGNLNRMFIEARIAEANRRLKFQGYITLNDVYDMLGMPKSKAGQAVGWALNHKNGDGFVKVTYISSPDAVKDFVNGDEPSVMIDFNVDGVIMDIFPEY